MQEITLSISIMHADWALDRKPVVAALAKQLAQEGGLIAPAEVIRDTTHQGVWATAKQAWLRGLKHGATHHLVLQDDVTICKDFIAGLKKALAAKPDAPVLPYANRKICEEAAARGDHWCTIGDGAWGQGFVLPTPLIKEWLLWDARNIDPAFDHDDSRLTIWLVKTSRPSWAMVPSIVDHLATMPSQLGHNNSTRVARRFVGVTGSALDIDWTKGLDAPLRASGSLGAFHKAAYIGD